MKGFIAFLFVGMLAVQGSAAVLIVSNNPNNPGQYTTPQAAHDAASPGDTLFILGSQTQYPSINVTKMITIIGTGHRPNTQSGLISSIGNCTFQPGSTGSKIYGLQFAQHCRFENGVDSVVVEGCKMPGFNRVAGTGHVMQYNLFVSAGGNSNLNFFGVFNIVIKNNVFNGQVHNLASTSVIFSNNLFLNSIPAFGSCSLGIFHNNIFYRASPTGISNAIFNNNLTYQCADNTLPPIGNTGTGNLAGTDPQFVNFPAAGANFSYSHDYHIQSGSPAENAGTDGTDLGLYGGMSEFTMTGEPAIPIIREFSIFNNILPPGGDMEINFKSDTRN